MDDKHYTKALERIRMLARQTDLAREAEARAEQMEDDMNVNEIRVGDKVRGKGIPMTAKVLAILTLRLSDGTRHNWIEVGYSWGQREKVRPWEIREVVR